MSEEDALLAAIRAKPDHDLPRLVYADWLDEHAVDRQCRECDGNGEIEVGRGRIRKCPCCTSGIVSDSRRERAEFIRFQCRLAERIVNGLSEDGPVAPLQRILDWLQSHGNEWFSIPEVTRPLRLNYSSLYNRSGQDVIPSRTLASLELGDGTGLRAYVSRGFIEKVMAPFSFLRGGLCFNCGQLLSLQDRSRPCRICLGTGGVKGVLPNLVRAWPITQVIVDLWASPLFPESESPEVRIDSEEHWYFCVRTRFDGPIGSHGTLRRRIGISAPLWQYLQGGTLIDPRIRCYETFHLMEQALGDAVLEEARQTSV